MARPFMRSENLRRHPSTKSPPGANAVGPGTNANHGVAKRSKEAMTTHESQLPELNQSLINEAQSGGPIEASAILEQLASVFFPVGVARGTNAFSSPSSHSQDELGVGTLNEASSSASQLFNFVERL